MYLVTFNNGTEQKFTSVVKAVQGIEASFQCGTKQELAEIKRSLRLTDLIQINHCMADEVYCWIEKA